MGLRSRHTDTPPTDALVSDPDTVVAADLPDPALPPQRRGEWNQAALTNVDITELVKSQIKTVTRPWNK